VLAHYKLLLFFISSFLFQGLFAQNNEVYVKVRDTWQVDLQHYDYSWSGINKAFNKYGVQVSEIERPFPDSAFDFSLSKIYKLKFASNLSADSLSADLNKIPLIDFAEPVQHIYLHYTPNDLKPMQWYLPKINALGAWDFGKSTYQCRIALLDNSVLITHTDLSSNIWTNSAEISGNFLDDDSNGYVDDSHGFDVADWDADVNPPSGISDSSFWNHGTHCAGICCGVTDNGKGISSIGFKTNLIPVKCSRDADTTAGLPFAAGGLYYALKLKPNVICMPFGFRNFSKTWEMLVQKAHGMHIFLVASSGNDSADILAYPAAYGNVFSVGATDQNDKLSSFSNYNKNLDAVAPGVMMYSCLASGNNNYGYRSGTSQAAALTAGLAALIKSQNFSYTTDYVEASLKKACDDVTASNAGKTDKLGAGRINAYKAVNPTAANVNFLQNEDFYLFPNPTHSGFTIKSKVSETPVFSVQITDANGKIILNENNIPPGLYSGFYVPVDSFVPGIYFARITSKNKLLQLPLMVK